MDEEVMTYLELLASHFDRQVLVTGDIETIDMESAPWLNNIIVDELRRFTIPNVISEDEEWKAYEWG